MTMVRVIRKELVMRCQGRVKLHVLSRTGELCITCPSAWAVHCQYQVQRVLCVRDADAAGDSLTVVVCRSCIAGVDDTDAVGVFWAPTEPLALKLCHLIVGAGVLSAPALSRK
jgi:hypothetical protein